MTIEKIPTRFLDTFQHFSVPEEMKAAFWNYFAYGYSPGSFGMALLKNNFAEAVLRAHPSLTADNFRDIAKWFYNVRLPRDAYGTDENIREWKSKTDKERLAILTELKLFPELFDVLRGEKL